MEITIPERLSHLPVCKRRGLPVPFANVVMPDGTPDFTVVDAEKVMRCAIEHRCGICGNHLPYWIAFLGGSKCVEFRAYLDPPMCVECAEWASQLCPYVARDGMKRRKSTLAESIAPAGFSEERPERFTMYVTRSFKWHITRDGAVMFTPAPHKELREVQSVCPA